MNRLNPVITRAGIIIEKVTTSSLTLSICLSNHTAVSSLVSGRAGQEDEMFEEWSVGNVAGVLVAVLLAVALIWGVVQLGPVAIDRWF